MKASTKKGMMIAGGMAVGAAVGGAAAVFAAGKLIADDPIPETYESEGRVLPVPEVDDEEGDDGDLSAEAVDPPLMSTEDIFTTSANMPEGDHHSPDYTPQV